MTPTKKNFEGNSEKLKHPILNPVAPLWRNRIKFNQPIPLAIMPLGCVRCGLAPSDDGIICKECRRIFIGIGAFTQHSCDGQCPSRTRIIKSGSQSKTADLSEESSWTEEEEAEKEEAQQSPRAWEDFVQTRSRRAAWELTKETNRTTAQKKSA